MFPGTCAVPRTGDRLKSFRAGMSPAAHGVRAARIGPWILRFSTRVQARCSGAGDPGPRSACADDGSYGGDPVSGIRTVRLKFLSVNELPYYRYCLNGVEDIRDTDVAPLRPPSTHPSIPSLTKRGEAPITHDNPMYYKRGVSSRARRTSSRLGDRHNISGFFTGQLMINNSNL